MMRSVLAGLMATALAGQVDAAVVTRDFSLKASSFGNFAGDPAPFATLDALFRVTYDDSGNGFLGAPDSFAATTDGQVNVGAFSAAPGFGYFQAGPFSSFPRIVLGGALNGTNVMLNGTNDFFFSFDASAVGPTRAMLSFTTPTIRGGFIATDAFVTERFASSAVPEPAAWAMLMSGFGMVAAMLRRRRGIRKFAAA